MRKDKRKKNLPHLIKAQSKDKGKKENKGNWC